MDANIFIYPIPGVPKPRAVPLGTGPRKQQASTSVQNQTLSPPHRQSTELERSGTATLPNECLVLISYYHYPEKAMYKKKNLHSSIYKIGRLCRVGKIFGCEQEYIDYVSLLTSTGHPELYNSYIW